MRILVPLLAVAALAAAEPAKSITPPDIRLGIHGGTDFLAMEGGAEFAVLPLGTADLHPVVVLGGGSALVDGDATAYALIGIYARCGRMLDIGTTWRGGTSTSDDRKHYGSASADATLWLVGDKDWSVGATASYRLDSESSGLSGGLIMTLSTR